MNTDFLAFRYKPTKKHTIKTIKPMDDRTLVVKQFYNGTIIGSFFSCIYKGELRIHIVFDDDTDEYNALLMELIDKTLSQADISGKVWVGNQNAEIIDFLLDQYHVVADAETFHYESVEYRMQKDCFVPVLRQNELIQKAYEEEHIDEYLELLNGAMNFFIPPHDFIAHKQKHINDFRRFGEKNTFQAFWKGNTVVGLYWLEGNEIDTIAISGMLQRQGYGRVILSDAIQTVFETSDAPYAVLYCVGWNHPAQTFYQKYGMCLHTRHYVKYKPEG